MTVSDDISIPHAGAIDARQSFTRSYRARHAGMDRGTRRMLLVAGGLGLVLLCGMGTWALMGRHQAGVPVVEADSRPIRVKPENPGGLQVVGANDEVMGGGRGANGPGTMAPASEAPAPLALRAQMQPPAPQPAASATAPEPQPNADAPVAAASGPRPAPASANPRRGTGSVMIQLAAVDNEPAVQSEWQRLARRMPELLGDRRLAVQRAEHDGHTVWRLRTGGFADIAEATGFCTKVKAKGAACTIASR